MAERRLLINSIGGELHVRECKEVPDNLKCAGDNFNIPVTVKTAS